jgi:7-alpha-hydroxysteroid dehydrogenase
VLERFRIDGRVAIVTGAGRGIGAAIAATYAEAGADVVLTARTGSALEEMAGTVRAHRRRAVVVPGDVNDLGFLPEMVERAVADLGRVDLVVNNAGGSVSQPILDTEPAPARGVVPLQRLGPARARATRRAAHAPA